MTVWTPEMGPGGSADDFGFGDLDDETAALLAAAAEQAPDQEEQQPDSAAADEPQGPAEAAAEQEDQPEPEAAEPTPEAPARTAPDVESVREAAEEIAMLDALKSWVEGELKIAKAKHAPMHADAANVGGSKTIPLKLDGVKIGTYNIAEPTIKTVWDDEAVLAYAEANSPQNVYETVDGTTAARYDDVAEFIRLTHPELIKREVRPAFLTTLVDQLDDECRLLDEKTGELVTLAKRLPVESDGSGRCGWVRPKGKPTGREQLIAAWRSGKFKPRGALANPAEPAPAESDAK
ncbi:hypothetical protein AB0F17_28870 [Nonomuraea sp. NPDC026600]|uniref:hypothetical protein n=1 Tax=Nonomuraea sp. NPDC026600 TaxID=3155363 RepID=UPI00340344CE